MSWKTSIACALILAGAYPSHAHQGPDPLAHWSFNSRSVEGDLVRARIGPDAVLEGGARVVSDAEGECVDFSGRGSLAVVAKDLKDVADVLPQEAMTISAWVAIDQPQEYGGIAGVIQDNGSAEAGWVLGYDREHYYFALATQGADDGDGHMTYLKSKTRYKPGHWAHVAAVYDGEKMELYVNGQLDASSREQSGPILYPESAPVVLAGYRDANEHYPHDGRLREVSIYEHAARETWVRHAFGHNQSLVALRPERPVNTGRADAFAFLVQPYLQFGTQDSMTVMCQTNQPGKTIVHYGETADCSQRISSDSANEIQEVTIEGLEPETQYFYRVESQSEHGETVNSRVSTFSTAVKKETPFAFAVISDSQWNAVVAAKISSLAWAQRPSFVMHAGDLVDTGVNDAHWTQHFFPSMNELISRVPMYPVLGNHEQNAQNYYDYMSLPSPEYFYDFQFGCVHFFMVDSNRNVGPGSEQYEWLDQRLDSSDALWKIVCHHHPAYSSDEDDFGNLWKTNKSTRGHLRIRPLTKLYDAHGVDVVWNGHIHSYERTWPVNGGRAVNTGEGPIYMITGGAGGGLETPGPSRPFFQNVVRRGHHYVMVHVNGPVIEFRSFDIDDRLFDTFTITKKDPE